MIFSNSRATEVVLAYCLQPFLTTAAAKLRKSYCVSTLMTGLKAREWETAAVKMRLPKKNLCKSYPDNAQ